MSNEDDGIKDMALKNSGRMCKWGGTNLSWELIIYYSLISVFTSEQDGNVS